MAKRSPLGALGTKDATPSREASTLRESHAAERLRAFDIIVGALEGLNRSERTNTIAAVAEFFGLTLTVDNG